TLGLADSPALDALRLALDEHGEVLRRMKREGASWSWPAFVAEVASASRDLDVPVLGVLGPSILIAAPSEAVGVSCRHLIFCGLGEGAFASSDATDEQADNGEPSPPSSSAEMLRFFRV